MAKPPPDLLTLLTRTFGAAPSITVHGSVSVAAGGGYQSPGLTTLVTMGCAAVPHTMWRGQQVGRELTLVTSVDVPGMTRLVVEAALEHLARKGRLDPVKEHGLYASDSPPHLLFDSDLTLVPALSGAEVARAADSRFPAVRRPRSRRR